MENGQLAVPLILALVRAEAHQQALATVLHRVREALPAAGDIGLVGFAWPFGVQ